MPIGSIAGLASAGTGEIGGAGQLGYGIYQAVEGNKQYNKLMANRPQRTTDINILNNQKLAQGIASEGIPDSAKSYYTDNINRTLGSGINAILEGGGDLNMINSLIGGATNSYKSLLAQDAQQKLANQGVELQANQNVANQNQENWNWNTADPYLTNLARATQQTNSGAQNIAGGFQAIGGATNAMSTQSLPFKSGSGAGGGSQNYSSAWQGLTPDIYGTYNTGTTGYPTPSGGGNSFDLGTGYGLAQSYGG